MINIKHEMKNKELLIDFPREQISFKFE